MAPPAGDRALTRSNPSLADLAMDSCNRFASVKSPAIGLDFPFVRHPLSRASSTLIRSTRNQASATASRWRLPALGCASIHGSPLELSGEYWLERRGYHAAKGPQRPVPVAQAKPPDRARRQPAAPDPLTALGRLKPSQGFQHCNFR